MEKEIGVFELIERHFEKLSWIEVMEAMDKLDNRNAKSTKMIEIEYFMFKFILFFFICCC